MVPPELEASGLGETIISGGIPRDDGGTYSCGVLKRFLLAGVAIDGEVLVEVGTICTRVPTEKNASGRKNAGGIGANPAPACAAHSAIG